MPALKTYVFENDSYSNITITIKAYSYEQAMNKLISVCKNPSDFLLIS